MKGLKTILVLFFSASAFFASGQSALKLKIPSIESSAGQVGVDYEITGNKANEHFNLEFRFKDRTGKLNAHTFSGEYGKNIGGGKHSMEWLTEKDKYVLDKEIAVQISLFQQPKIPVGAHLMKSLVMPGLGDYRLRNGWGYFLISAGAYGSVGSAVYFNYAANNSYSNYLKSDDAGKRNDLFAQANNNRNYMYASIAAAAAIWAVDVILVAVKAGKVKKSLTEKSSKYYFKKYNTPIEVESPFTYVNTKSPYDIAIERGEKYLSEKSYEGARSAFLEAQKLKPGELLPEAKLAQIDKEVAAIKAKEDAYTKFMKEGNDLFAAGNYDAAKNKYKEALKLKASDATATAKLNEIEKIEADKAKEAKYDDLMARGNNAMTKKEYETAIEFFTDASELFPGRALPKTKVGEAESMLETKKTENYKRKLAEAETALSNKEYTRAKMLFEEASAMKPFEEYPKMKIAEIDNMYSMSKSYGSKEELYNSCEKAVFFIYSESYYGEASTGTGFFISADGVAISNYHVYNKYQDATVYTGGYLSSKEEVDKSKVFEIEKVLEQNKEKDYVIFQVKKKNYGQKFNYLQIASKSPAILDDVLAIGNPSGFLKVPSPGVVKQFLEDNNIKDYYILTDVDVTHGNSGGPLLNYKAEVVGIMTAAEDHGRLGLNYAINIQKLPIWKYK